MAKNLTNSYCDRQKILNNPYILSKVDKYFNLDWRLRHIEKIPYQDNLFFSKRHLEYLLDTSISIINKCIRNNEQELKINGYIYKKDEKLQEQLKSLDPRFAKSIELFSFKALLNMAMLIPQNEKTKFMRGRILDIVIDSISSIEGCRIKYLNQSIQYIFPMVHKKYYSLSKALQDAINRYLEYPKNWDDFNKLFDNSYIFSKSKSNNKSNLYLAYYNYDKIYWLIFNNQNKRYIHEQYRQLLENNTRFNCINESKQKIEAGFGRNHSSVSRINLGLYAEIMSIIRKIEDIVAEKLQLEVEQQKRRISVEQLDEIVLNLESDSQAKTLIQEARIKMAWRDLPYGEIFHKRLENHNKTISKTDLDEFIAAKSKSVKDKLAKPEILAVFQRLQKC